MKIISKISSIFAIIIAFITLSYTPSFAQLQDFEESNDKLYVGWLDLAQEYDPLTEYGAYAIVWSGGENLPIFYTIFSDFKGKTSILGAFRCDKEFTVLESVTNGMRDIRCVKQDVFGQKTTTILRFSDAGLYEEVFD